MAATLVVMLGLRLSLDLNEDGEANVTHLGLASILVDVTRHRVAWGDLLFPPASARPPPSRNFVAAGGAIRWPRVE